MSNMTGEERDLVAARQMWAAYSMQAGGVTYDGNPLPTWDGLGEDRQSCWVAAAHMARSIFDPDFDVDS